MDWFLFYTPHPINQRIVSPLCSDYTQNFHWCHPGLSCIDPSSLVHAPLGFLLISWFLPLLSLGYFSPSNQSYHFTVKSDHVIYCSVWNPPMAFQFTQAKSQTSSDGFHIFTWATVFFLLTHSMPVLRDSLLLLKQTRPALGSNFFLLECFSSAL